MCPFLAWQAWDGRGNWLFRGWWQCGVSPSYQKSNIQRHLYSNILYQRESRLKTHGLICGKIMKYKRINRKSKRGGTRSHYHFDAILSCRGGRGGMSAIKTSKLAIAVIITSEAAMPATIVSSSVFIWKAWKFWKRHVAKSHRQVSK